MPEDDLRKQKTIRWVSLIITRTAPDRTLDITFAPSSVTMVTGFAAALVRTFGRKADGIFVAIVRTSSTR